MFQRNFWGFVTFKAVELESQSTENDRKGSIISAGKAGDSDSWLQLFGRYQWCLHGPREPQVPQPHSQQCQVVWYGILSYLSADDQSWRE